MAKSAKTRERDDIWGYCDACEAPLRLGMKINEAPCPDHDTCVLVYCDACVEEAERRLESH
jgi:hypothetical protein